MSTVFGYLIDPQQRTIERVRLANAEPADRLDKAVSAEMLEIAVLAEMRRLIGAATLDHQTISDSHDSIWLDDGGLERGLPIHAFLLPMQRVPCAGRAVVIGADDAGRTRSPTPQLLRCLVRDIEWLGRIRPEVIWDYDRGHFRTIITYAPAEPRWTTSDASAPSRRSCDEEEGQ